MGARTEPKNSERNYEDRAMSTEYVSGPAPCQCLPVSYLLGWGRPRHCVGLRIFIFLLLLRAVGAAGALEVRGEGALAAAHRGLHGDHVGVDVVTGKAIQVGRTAGREQRKRGVQAGPTFWPRCSAFYYFLLWWETRMQAGVGWDAFDRGSGGGRHPGGGDGRLVSWAVGVRPPPSPGTGLGQHWSPGNGWAGGQA